MPLEERRTFKLHLIYSIIEGALAGILLMNEYVFIRSMKGSKEMLALLFQVSMIILLGAIFINPVLKRIKSKRTMLLWTAFLTRGPLVLMFFFPDNAGAIRSQPLWQGLFIGLFLIYYCASPVIFPTINQLLKANYSHEGFGRYFSYATSAKKGVALMTAFMFGVWLDHDGFAFRILYPLMGVAGILSILLLSAIPFSTTGEVVTVEKKEGALKKMFTTLRSNRRFFDFEVGFMFYGFAFMVTVSVISIFCNEILGMSFSTNAFYKAYYNILAIILLPLCGRLISKVNPGKFAAWTYLSLFFYLLFLMLAEYMKYETMVCGIQFYPFVFAAFTSFGVFTAMMALLWGIGSAYFCKREEAGDYQAIHVTLTGFRALFAPLMGVSFLPLLGYSGIFTVGMVSLLIAVIYMAVAAKRM